MAVVVEQARVMTLKQVAAAVQVSVRAVRRAIARRELGVTVLGPRTVRVPVASFEAWVAKRTIKEDAPQRHRGREGSGVQGSGFRVQEGR